MAGKMAVLLDPGHPAHAVEWRYTQAAARTLVMLVYPIEVRATNEIDVAFAKMLQERVSAAIPFEGLVAAGAS